MGKSSLENRKKSPLSNFGSGFLVGADRRLRSVRGAPVELFFGLRGDAWVGVIVTSTKAASVAGGAVSDDGHPSDRDLTFEPGAERAGGRRDTVDEPDGMLRGACMHDDLTYGLVKNDSGQKKTAPEDG